MLPKRTQLLAEGAAAVVAVDAAVVVVEGGLEGHVHVSPRAVQRSDRTPLQ